MGTRWHQATWRIYRDRAELKVTSASITVAGRRGRHVAHASTAFHLCSPASDTVLAPRLWIGARNKVAVYRTLVGGAISGLLSEGQGGGEGRGADQRDDDRQHPAKKIGPID